MAIVSNKLCLKSGQSSRERPDSHGARQALVPVTTTLAAWILPVAILPGLLAATGPARAEDAPATVEYRQLIESLKGEYSDRDSVRKGSQSITSRLLDFVHRHGDAPEVGDARILAAEVFLLAGQRKAARDLWNVLAREGPRAEDRARGLYLQGEYYFLYFLRRPENLEVHAKYRKAALHYFSKVKLDFPDSPLARAAERPLNYMRLLGEKMAPTFEATFRRGQEVLRVRSEDLRGKVILIIFWKASTEGHRRFEEDFSKKLAQVLVDYAQLEGQVEVLGVNLDRESRYFDVAVREWKIRWPQLHDGKAFETDLARLFSIPRAPHFVVIDEDGGLAYLGAGKQRFLGAASAALKKRRLSLEAASGEKEE